MMLQHKKKKICGTLSNIETKNNNNNDGFELDKDSLHEVYQQMYTQWIRVPEENWSLVSHNNAN